MDMDIVLYEMGVSPLQKVKESDIILGDSYVTEDGDQVKVLENGESFILELVKNSPLVEGEYMSELNDNQLKLFWILISK